MYRKIIFYKKRKGMLPLRFALYQHLVSDLHQVSFLVIQHQIAHVDLFSAFYLFHSKE